MAIRESFLLDLMLRYHGGNMKSSQIIYLYSPEKDVVRMHHVSEELCLHRSQHSLQFHSTGFLLLPLLP